MKFSIKLILIISLLFGVGCTQQQDDDDHAPVISSAYMTLDVFLDQEYNITDASVAQSYINALNDMKLYVTYSDEDKDVSTLSVSGTFSTTWSVFRELINVEKTIYVEDIEGHFTNKPTGNYSVLVKVKDSEGNESNSVEVGFTIVDG